MIPVRIVASNGELKLAFSWLFVRINLEISSIPFMSFNTRFIKSRIFLRCRINVEINGSDMRSILCGFHKIPTDSPHVSYIFHSYLDYTQLFFPRNSTFSKKWHLFKNIIDLGDFKITRILNIFDSKNYNSVQNLTSL